MIGQHQRHHRFADRYGADANAGVVPALGDDVHILAKAIHPKTRFKNGTGGLHREARHNRLAGADAAQNAAGVIGLESHQAALRHPHFIRIGRTGQASGGEAITNLHAFDGVDAHERAGQIRIQFAVNGRAQAGGHTFGHNFDHRTH